MAFQKSDKIVQKRSRLIRLIILVFILVFTTVSALLHQYSKAQNPQERALISKQRMLESL